MSLSKTVVFCFLSCLFSNAFCTDDNQQQQDILGNWHCKVNVNLGAVTLNLDFKNQFNSDKTATGQGIVSVTNSMIGMDLLYRVNVDQTWFIKESVLYQDITSRKITSLKPSFYEPLYDTDNFLIVGQQEQTQIKSLTKTQFDGLYNGFTLNCLRPKLLQIQS